LQQALIHWSDSTRRDLPWRHTRDPWAVLVSELMLQQTQVARVVPKYHGFLTLFPTPAACAAVPAGDVVRAWAGLGYNRRALNLHRTAVAVVERHSGALPDDLDALLALPGVGPYTARAVLAFAFERDVGVLDVNAARVVHRTAGRRLAPAAAQVRADALVPAGQGWRWNQAMLDLGATVCTRRAPRCGVCPIAAACAWGGDGPDPAPEAIRQSTFLGSDRQGRGRLVDALRDGAVAIADIATVAGWPGDPTRALRVADGLVSDGLATVAGDTLALP
jgi:A/G-specific adenine glycosylase